jgi:hypothetical protein
MKLPRSVISPLIAIISLIVGSSAGLAWSWWKDEAHTSHTERLALMNIVIDDERCDSGFQISWLANSYFVSSTGERLAKLKIPATEQVACKDGVVWVDALVQPTESWVYRLEIASPSSSMVIDKFTVRNEMQGNEYGPAYAYLGLTADCASGTLLCP